MGAAIAYSAYRRSEIETLSPRDLVVKLYEGLDRFIEQAALAMDNKHHEMAAVNCRKVREILFELQSTLNHEVGGEIARQLDQLYSFLILEVTAVGLSKDGNRMRQLHRVVRPLAEAWKGIPDEHAHLTSLTGGGKANIIDMRT